MRKTITTKRQRPGKSLSSSLPSDVSLLPPTAWVDAGQVEILKIIDEKVIGGMTVYRIRWKGYSAAYDTWEPENNLGGYEETVNSWKQQNIGSKKRPHRGSLSNGTNTPSKKTRASPDGKGDERKEVLTLAEAMAGVEGISIMVDLAPKVSAQFRPAMNKLPKAPPYEPKPTRPAVLVHPDYKAFVKKLEALPGPTVDLVNEIDDEPSPPVDFEFLTELKLADDVPPFDPDFVVGCSCPESGCTDADECECLDDLVPRRFAYSKHGRVVRKNYTAIFECNNKCSCGTQCSNRVVQNGRKERLQIFKTEMKGWGIRSPDFIKKGTFIDRYLGEVIGHKESSQRAEEGHQQGLSYLFDLDKFSLEEVDEEEEIDPISMDIPGAAPDRGRNSDDRDKYTIDGRICGTVTRFINHSCDPNLETYAVASDRRDGKVYDLALFANRDIEPYEELAFSYVDVIPSVVGGHVGEKSWPCYCGSVNCVRKLWSY